MPLQVKGWTGEQKIDTRLTNAEMAARRSGWEQPTGWQWHHEDLSGKMVLVPEDLHGLHHSGPASYKRRLSKVPTFKPSDIRTIPRGIQGLGLVLGSYGTCDLMNQVAHSAHYRKALAAAQLHTPEGDQIVETELGELAMEVSIAGGTDMPLKIWFAAWNYQKGSDNYEKNMKEIQKANEEHGFFEAWGQVFDMMKYPDPPK